MKGKVAIIVFMAFLAVVTGSCTRGPRVIPVHKMEKIYHDMFLADQWIAENPSLRATADTTWFYEPIFEKYGFTVKDYRKSVDHYLNDPKRYAEMMGRVAESLKKEGEAIDRQIARNQQMRHVADSIANAIRNIAPDDFPYYSDLFYVDAMTDRIDIRKNARGVWFPVPVVEDTVFHGPELIIRDTLSVSEASPAPEEETIPPLLPGRQKVSAERIIPLRKGATKKIEDVEIIE